MDSKIHIVLAFDENFAMPCGVTIISICENTPDDIVFHLIVADDVTEDSKEKISGIVRSYDKDVKFYSIDESVFRELPDTQYITKSTYFRLLIPEIFPVEIEKVLYLDSDLVALKSIKPLWDTELTGEEPVAMAIDGNCNNVTFHNFTEIPLSQPYYNAGVVLMNLNCWRKENIGRRCIEKIAEKHYRYMDQDALNVVIGERIKPIHLKYNLQLIFLSDSEKYWRIDRERYFEQVYEAKESPVILHYAHPKYKPWYRYTYHNEQWLYYKALSPWENEPQCKGEKVYRYIDELNNELNKINPKNKLGYKNNHRFFLWIAGEMMRVTNWILKICQS